MNSISLTELTEYPIKFWTIKEPKTNEVDHYSENGDFWGNLKREQCFI